MYGSLPKYGTFKDEVKVVDVNTNDPPPGTASSGVVASGTATKDANDNGTVDSDDDDGQTDLQAMLPNTEDSNVEYIYTRNALEEGKETNN